MVTAAPNLTHIEGTVLGQAPSTRFAGWQEVEVLLNLVEPAEGQRSVVAAQPGDVLRIAVAPELIRGDVTGCDLDCRVALTSHGLRAEPRPEPGNFAVTARGDPHRATTRPAQGPP